MPLTEKQKKRIEKMAKEGKTFTFISEKLFNNYDHYDEIQSHCWETRCISWQGAKKMISNRLKILNRQSVSDFEKGQALKEIGEFVEYLYQCGRALEQKIDKIRDALR
jgi:hypothetical protein